MVYGYPHGIKEFLIIGFGGFFGAIFRYVISNIIPAKFGLPLGTFAVNLIGSFIVGFFMYSPLNNLHPEYRFLIITGFCGALSTFSTFTYENFFLLERGYFINVIVNIFLNILGCLMAIYMGKSLSMFLLGNY